MLSHSSRVIQDLELLGDMYWPEVSHEGQPDGGSSRVYTTGFAVGRIVFLKSHIYLESQMWPYVEMGYLQM